MLYTHRLRGQTGPEYLTSCHPAPRAISEPKHSAPVATVAGQRRRGHRGIRQHGRHWGPRRRSLRLQFFIGRFASSRGRTKLSPRLRGRCIAPLARWRWCRLPIVGRLALVRPKPQAELLTARRWLGLAHTRPRTRGQGGLARALSPRAAQILHIRSRSTARCLCRRIPGRRTAQDRSKGWVLGLRHRYHWPTESGGLHGRQRPKRQADLGQNTEPKADGKQSRDHVSHSRIPIWLRK